MWSNRNSSLAPTLLALSSLGLASFTRSSDPAPVATPAIAINYNWPDAPAVRALLRQGASAPDQATEGLPSLRPEIWMKGGKEVVFTPNERELTAAPLLVYVGAGYCAPCIASLPWLGELARANANSGLSVVFVSLDSPRAFLSAVKRSQGQSEAALLPSSVLFALGASPWESVAAVPTAYYFPPGSDKGDGKAALRLLLDSPHAKSRLEGEISRTCAGGELRGPAFTDRLQLQDSPLRAFPTPSTEESLLQAVREAQTGSPERLLRMISEAHSSPELADHFGYSTARLIHTLSARAEEGSEGFTSATRAELADLLAAVLPSLATIEDPLAYYTLVSARVMPALMMVAEESARVLAREVLERHMLTAAGLEPDQLARLELIRAELEGAVIGHEMRPRDNSFEIARTLPGALRAQLNEWHSLKVSHSVSEFCRIFGEIVAPRDATKTDTEAERFFASLALAEGLQSTVFHDSLNLEEQRFYRTVALTALECWVGESRRFDELTVSSLAYLVARTGPESISAAERARIIGALRMTDSNDPTRYDKALSGGLRADVLAIRLMLASNLER